MAVFSSLDSLASLSQADLIGVVRELVGEVARLVALNEKLTGDLVQLRAGHAIVKDELARLKGLPPRPPVKPSGMDKAADAPKPERGAGKDKPAPRRRGGLLDKLKITQTIVVEAQAPCGSRRKGFEDIVVQDIILAPQVTLYRRERWETADGKTIIAALDPAISGGYGPHLQRLVPMLHFAGQVTCERMVALLNGMGIVISKRQVVRLLTARLEVFRAEDAAVLKAGLNGAYVTVDDTGARHAGKNGYTTHIGSDHFAVFRTGPSKSRLAFLSRLCGQTALYVVNDAALQYMTAHKLPQGSIALLATHPDKVFSDPADWRAHLAALGLAALAITPDPVQVASEAALWGGIRHQGLLGGTIIVSDGAGQFHIGDHALCWVSN